MNKFKDYIYIVNQILTITINSFLLICFLSFINNWEKILAKGFNILIIVQERHERLHQHK
jgi:hypothetical protein